jgi:hypothetical protein
MIENNTKKTKLNTVMLFMIFILVGGVFIGGGVIIAVMVTSSPESELQNLVPAFADAKPIIPPAQILPQLEDADFQQSVFVYNEEITVYYESVSTENLLNETPTYTVPIIQETTEIVVPSPSPSPTQTPIPTQTPTPAQTPTQISGDDSQVTVIPAIRDWRDEFVTVLRGYPLRFWDTERWYWGGYGGFFLLHDINRDGIPELITIGLHHQAVYKFTQNGVVSLEVGDDISFFGPFVAGGGVITYPIGNVPGIITTTSYVFGWFASLMVIEGNRLVIESDIRSVHGFDFETDLDFTNWWIDNREVSQADFYQKVDSLMGVGRQWTREGIPHYLFTDANIQSVIFGW